MWGVVGLFYDFDYECWFDLFDYLFKGVEIFVVKGVLDEIIYVIKLYVNYIEECLCVVLLDKVLFVCDELVGFIMVCLMV